MNNFPSKTNYLNRCQEILDYVYDGKKHPNSPLNNSKNKESVLKNCELYFNYSKNDMIRDLRSIRNHYELCDQYGTNNCKNKFFKNNDEFYGFMYAYYTKICSLNDFNEIDELENERIKSYDKDRKAGRTKTHQIRLSIIKNLDKNLI